jgi:glycosyltransferase involved in cell wall biosynthesis
MKSDLISVVIPAYNAEEYLQESLDSLYDQISPVDFEIIVVNDGSTDRTLQILEAQGDKIRVFSHANSGVCKTRNLGFKAAKGNYITCLDADDLYEPDKLDKQYRYLKDHPNLDMVFCKVEQFISPELDPSDRKIPEHVRVMNSMNFAGGLFKSEVFEKNGYIDESLRSYGEFIDWFARAKEIGLKYAVMDEILYKRRVHDSNYGKVNASEQMDYLKVLRAKIQRSKGKPSE